MTPPAEPLPGRRGIRAVLHGILAATPLILCLSLPQTGRAAPEPPSPRRVLEEINLARATPLRYAAYLRSLRRGARGTLYRIPGSPTPVQSSEGTAALDEAIRFLERQRPLAPLSWSPGLAAAATELTREQAASGTVGHQGSCGGMRERIERHGSWRGRIAENIAYGPGDHRGMVLQLIINDGVPGRGHRKNLFRRAFALAGIACAPHPRFGSLCVMDFAARFIEP